MESHTETQRIDRHAMATALSSGLKPADFGKILEELKALKQRSYTLDLQKLEDAHRQELETAMKAAEKRAKGGPELLKAQAEERRIAEAKHVRDKELLTAKFQRLDQTLLSLGSFLTSVGPVREMEAKFAEREAVLKKHEDDLNVQRKVFAREKDELDEDRRKLEAAEAQLREREEELVQKLKNIDIVARAAELDQLQSELNEKIRSYGEQEAVLEKQREELNRDFDKLGEARADVDRVVEGLEAERDAMNRQKASMADSVAKEMAATFEGFVRDMLKESAAKAPPGPPSPPPAAKKVDLWGDLS
jgi:DNA repair exonuclease SbcCD ATPase subunit